MSSSSRTLVHRLVASPLGVDESLILDERRFDALGLDLLDLVVLVLQLESLRPGHGDFPLATLDCVTTVGELVDLVDLWLGRAIWRSHEHR
jgi:hypothetical protein